MILVIFLFRRVFRSRLFHRRKTALSTAIFLFLPTHLPFLKKQKGFPLQSLTQRAENQYIYFVILDFLFPNRCLNCNRIIPAEEIVCEACFNQIHFTHWNFISENILKQKCRLLFPVENAFALLQFEKESLTRKIVHELKYKNREKVSKILAKWTIEKFDFQDQKPDLIVTVPLHPRKQKERGYNQLHLFADTISRKFNIPTDHFLIKRNRYKKAQALKDKAHRAETENVFSITKPIENQHILLIDDVFTTGNTMASVAWEILKSGNNKVSILVMAVD